ncbi:hypothetical protein CONLIGDRAFT_276194 [Coniochaeta ligniaria NRRL 30616]|uniref:Uncharacterized protein n=1 Tax=Coniochaeta ligniaria NRRL 30616 TaxID=1408157 RepID=A0A1J7IY50_9PEZI|nr:hypothetical protein CONLIGDRAFT_276194 [Coniochaeta ligniaria NRRL 30616]
MRLQILVAPAAFSAHDAFPYRYRRHVPSHSRTGPSVRFSSAGCTVYTSDRYMSQRSWTQRNGLADNRLNGVMTAGYTVADILFRSALVDCCDLHSQLLA